MKLLIKDIKTNPKNPRLIKDDKFKKLVQSLKDFPEMADVREIVVNKDHVVLGGNMRLKAMQEAGWKEAPVKVVDWSQDKQDEFVVKDNASFGEWDWDELANQYEVAELIEWGVDLPDSLLPEEEVEEDEAPEVSSEPAVSKLGEIYQLGRHRVMCGDSTSKENVSMLMARVKADMVFTDPPYGMGKENEGVQNDNLYNDKLLAFNQKWIPLSFEALKENGSWYCWGIDEPLMDIYSDVLKPMIKKNLMTFRNLITWDKGNGQGQKAEEFRSYAVADEKCLFTMMGVQGFNTNQDNYYEGWESIRLYLEGEKKKMGWTDKWIAEQMGIDPRLHWFGKSQWDLPTQDKYEKLQELAQGDAFKKDYDEIKKDYDEIKKDYEKIKREYYSTRAYFDNTHDNMNNVWHFDRTSQKERIGNGEHATPKPIALCSRGIKSSSKENEIVLDIFLGSGSTLIACEQTDRTCYGMELDPKYVDVIRKRYAKFTNNNELPENWAELTPVV